MRYRFEVSAPAQRQLARLPRVIQERIAKAVDEMERLEDSQWSNVKALLGPAWKGRFRKKIGPYRVIFTKLPDIATAVISGILIRSENTYK
jgi:mRNA-degrading endonuclease RelE of RelBE toxin-antitoxin system